MNVWISRRKQPALLSYDTIAVVASAFSKGSHYSARLKFPGLFSGDAMSTKPNKRVETFPNPRPERHFEIHFECPEFTCLCPMTGQPDFATILIDYVPDALCVELKSLKLYLWSYRNEGAFHEAVTNQILDDLVSALKPRQMTVTGKFLVRGGIYTTVIARHPDR